VTKQSSEVLTKPQGEVVTVPQGEVLTLQHEQVATVRPVIEEIKSYTELHTQGSKPEYSVFVERYPPHRSLVKIEYRMPPGTSLPSIDLQVSAKVLRLKSGDTELSLEFVFSLVQDSIKAKWLKRSSTLVVTLTRQ
jgi:hypothetical protein